MECLLFFVIWGTIFPFIKHYELSSRYREKTTTTTITSSSSMEVFFYLLRLSSGQEGKLWFPLHPPPSIHPPAIQSWFCSSQHWVKYKLNRSNQSPNPDCYPRQPLICGASKSYSSSTCRPLFLVLWERKLDSMGCSKTIFINVKKLISSYKISIFAFTR